MNRIVALLLVLTIGPFGLFHPIRSARAASEVFAPPKSDEIHIRINQWLSGQQVSDSVRGCPLSSGTSNFLLCIASENFNRSLTVE